MSILSQLLQGKISLAQAFGEAETWLGKAEASIEKSIVGDPGVQALRLLLTRETHPESRDGLFETLAVVRRAARP